MPKEFIVNQVKAQLQKRKATLQRSNPHLLKSLDALIDFGKNKKDSVFGGHSRFTVPLAPVDRVFLGQGGYQVQFVCRFEHPMDPGLLEASFYKAQKDFWPLRAQVLRNDKTALLVGTENEIDLKTEKLDHLPFLQDPSEASYVEAKLDDQNLTSAHFLHSNKESLLSFAFPHFMADGYSLFYFLMYWAEIARSMHSKPKERIKKALSFPKLERPIAIAPNSRLFAFEETPPTEEESETFFQDTGLFLASRRGKWGVADANWKYITLYKKDLDIEVKQCLKKGIKVSHHDLLSSKVWKKVAREHHSNDNQTLFNSSMVDYRRLKPELGHRYFGNAIRGTGFSLTRKQLLESSDIEIALRVRSSIQSINAHTVDVALHRLNQEWEKRSFKGMEHIHVSHPSRGLLVTNLSRVSFQDIDFGFGCPVEITSLTPAPRTAVVTYTHGKYLVRLQL